MKGRWLFVSIATMGLVPVVAFLLIVFWMGFWQGSPGDLVVYTLKHYRELFTDASTYRTLLNTLGFASTTVLISLSFAMPIEFFGSINWLRGKMLDGARVETESGTLVIQAPRQYEGSVVVGVRPENAKWFQPLADMENRFAATVLSITFLGDQATSEVKINDKILLAKTLPDDAKPAGAILVQLPKAKIVVFPETATQRDLDHK